MKNKDSKQKLLHKIGKYLLLIFIGVLGGIAGKSHE